MTTSMYHNIAVDLFCGGGGLTVGLKDAGFSVVAAVENEENAAATFQANHQDTKLFVQDIRTISGADLLDMSPTRKIDLLSGCPPCQGFTSLTAKYKRDDPRNLLINEMLRIIEETTPTAIMMENVPGLTHRGSKIFLPFVTRLAELGYIPNWKILQVADYGVPQYRRRLVLLAGKGFKIEMPPPTHSKDGRGLPGWRTVRDTIAHMGTPLRLSEAKACGPFPPSSWHIVRDISSKNMERLRAAHPGASWTMIPEDLRPVCHHGSYRGFSNVYGRMQWDDVSPTITGGCTTLSRGRYGHPEQDRTISVREAALLQTFPLRYIIDTKYMEHACKIIGNALPCLFARRVAEQCYAALEEHVR